MSPVLGNLIEVTGLSLPLHVGYENWVFEGNTAFFKNASLKGNITIKSSSFTDFTINDLVNLNIITDREQKNMTDIKGLYINATDYTEIYAKETEIHQGNGFYANLTLNNPTLFTSGENVLITLVKNNDETMEITLHNGEITMLGQLTLEARTPIIQVNGEANFSEMYSLFSLYSSLRSLGHDLNITGTVEFQLTASDVYNFATNLKWNGLKTREPPILPWDEYDSIKNMLPWIIISISLLIFWYTFPYQKAKPDSNKIGEKTA